jgi:vacuolar-type H+-ATPase subunit H
VDRAGGVSKEREDAVVSDAIREIREAEKEAVDRERQARADSKRLVAEAHEATEKLLEEMRRSVREEERTLTATAAAEAEREAARIAAESRAAVEALRGDAEARVRRGVARVLDAIVSGS